MNRSLTQFWHACFTILGKGLSGSILLTIAKNLSQLGAAILLARLLAPSGYGEYAFAISLANLLGIAASFGFPLLLTREIAAANATNQWGSANNLIRVSNRASLTSLVLITIAGLVLTLTWPGLNTGFKATLILGFFYLNFFVFAQLRGSVLMGLNKVLWGQVGQNFVQPTFILLMTIAFWATFDIRLRPEYAAGFAVSSAAFVFLLNAMLCRHFFPRGTARINQEDSTPVSKWLIKALPFALMNGLYLFNSQIDIVMLGIFSPKREVGLYKVAASGAALIPVVLAGINPVLGPAFSRHFALGEFGRLRRLMKLGTLLSFAGAAPGVILYLFFGKSIITLVFGIAYLGAWLPLMILAVGQFFNAAMGPVGLILNMTRNENETLWVMAASAAINLLLDLVLIPKYGPVGAATATAISLIFWNLTLALRVRAKFRTTLGQHP